MIRSWADATTSDIYNGKDTKAARALDKQLWKIVVRKLDMLHAAVELRDLSAPPGNRLEALKGKLRGRYSLRVNDQYRITFKWAEGNAELVQVEDYHQ